MAGSQCIKLYKSHDRFARHSKGQWLLQNFNHRFQRAVIHR